MLLNHVPLASHLMKNKRIIILLPFPSFVLLGFFFVLFLPCSWSRGVAGIL
jgi:hypothetical protein